MFSLQSEVQVFTLGKPSWRSLGKIAHHLYAQGPSQVIVNGRLHRTTWPRRRLPCWGSPSKLRQLEIWVMKEYDVKESWIKEFNIAIHVPRRLEHADRNSAKPFRDSKFYRKRSFVRVLGLLKNGEVLLEYKCRALVTYDKKDGTFKDLTILRMPYWFEAVVHEGSLNWIDTLTGQ
ncbi:hypothetical protein LWI29_000527 [Acer saccharum]|uniref:F-box associated domain-containing protein n=1 Tax=Acer saccharum TaxID=4024 RepID=A0AA39SNT0_ACESA|nr:hypothetical protein LWI29_000527 [Acer saccharum]